MNPSNTKGCNCAEISCKEGCSGRHTHKGFWCKKCHPERYEETYPSTTKSVEDVVREFEEKFNHASLCNEGEEGCTCAAQEFVRTQISSLLTTIIGEIEARKMQPKLHSKGSVGDVHNKALETAAQIIRNKLEGNV